MNNEKKYPCKICNQRFTRTNSLKKHVSTKHSFVSLSFSCYLCRKNFKNQSDYLKHIDDHKEGLKFVLYKDAFDGAIKVFRKHFNDRISIYSILDEVNDISAFLQTQLLVYPKYKVNLLVVAEYLLKESDNLISEKELFNLRSSNFIISRSHSNKSLKTMIKKHLFEVISREKEMNLPNSGWVSNKIIFIDIAIHKMNLLI